MIIELIFNLFFGLIHFIIGLLPIFDLLVIPVDLMATFVYVLELCGYFLPIADMSIMLGIWVSIVHFHWIYALLIRIWDSLPFT